MVHILIVEDDSSIRESLQLYLQNAGYNTAVAENGVQALALLEHTPCDLVISDIAMPVLDGIELLKHIRGNRAGLPVILLSAKKEEFDIVLGLELGADDYVTKPFSPRELTARVKNALRKKAPAKEKNGELSFGRLRLDLLEHKAWCNNQLLQLTNSEYDLLRLLLSSPNHVFSREELLAKVWSDNGCMETRTVDQHIKNLRQKLDAAHPEGGRQITSVRGVGYKLELTAAA